MTTSDPRLAPEGDDEITLLELLGVIWAGKSWIALTVFLALCLGSFLILRSQPQYQALGQLQIEAKTGSLALPEGMQELLGSSSGNAAGEAEIQIMRSRMVLGPVVEELGLQIFARPRQLPVVGMVPARLDLPDTGIALLRPFQWGNERIRLGELEVPEALLGQPLTLRITGPGDYRYEGADLGILITRGRVMNDAFELNERATNWIRGIKRLYASKPLTEIQRDDAPEAGSFKIL